MQPSDSLAPALTPPLHARAGGGCARIAALQVRGAYAQTRSATNAVLSQPRRAHPWGAQAQTRLEHLTPV
eukprot:4787025-Lingulodinium_polyedra.AAC.1